MKTTAVKTVGILTSGGDAPGLNAAIRALCVAGKNKYGMKFIGIRNGYRGLPKADRFHRSLRCRPHYKGARRRSRRALFRHR